MTEPATPTHTKSSLNAHRRRARKSASVLAGSDLVKIAIAHDQVEAEFLQGLLGEQGVPSVLRRSPGFDVPGFLVAGRRDVLVPASSAQVARDLLGETGPESVANASASPGSSARVRAWVLVAAALVVAMACVVVDLLA